MKRMIFFLLFLFVLSNISASCNETQVDINSASLEELDKIVNIGPARAGQIVSLRPFSSVDDLIRVIGIGNATLTEIKLQGLACVKEETNNEEENSTPEVNKTIPLSSNDETPEEYFPENFTMPKITMNSNSQSIKTIENEQKNSKIDFAVYGLAGFSFLLATLFAIKKFKKNKNEFRK